MGQRARLFALATELGTADITHSGAATEQAQRCLAMTQELREHADHEDTFIHQLLRERAPEAADALDAEHIRLDAAFTTLDERARSLPDTPAEDLLEAQHARAYLAHLHLEETVAMPALWQHAADTELGAVLTAFRASRTPEEALIDLRRMLPALPPAVRAVIARAVVEAAPGQEAGLLAEATTTLSPSQRQRLYDDLGVPETWALQTQP
ncbi:hypothetical protein GCM10017687_68210 [Streptomyces echinatus]|uniref:Hemerythrin-like domain-containing protein n=2 Tax=Streptomyces echinatus TaxID=67293 RepID=A0A7W9Q234_9ACTN|nr:hemerythrin domain-containing protein [Streptomyces echinatus]MBB5932186.1 hypothetical protein [Streptomyces echinatus]